MRKIIAAAARVRFIRFMTVGVTNTVADFVLLNVLLMATGVTVAQKTATVMLNVFSASCIAVLSFFLNKKFVFNHESSEKMHHKLVLFVAITLSGLFIVQGVIFALLLTRIQAPSGVISRLCDRAGLHFVTTSFVQTNVTKVLATIASMLWNYFLYKKFVFKELSVEEGTLVD